MLASRVGRDPQGHMSDRSIIATVLVLGFIGEGAPCKPNAPLVTISSPYDLPEERDAIPTLELLTSLL